jgi:hypothetical protein
MKNMIFLVALSMISTSFSQTDWKLEYNKNGIEVYTRKPEGQNTKEYKGIVEVNASVEACVKALSQPYQFTKFMYNVTYAEKIESTSAEEFVVYCIVDFPWPYTDRDMCLNYHFYDLVNGNVKAKLYSVADKKNDPAYEYLGGVIGSWYFEKISDTKTRVTNQSKSSQTGFPDWLVNMFLLDAPKFNMPNFKSFVESNK